MELYLADVTGLEESRAIHPPRSGQKGSAFGMSLLQIAVYNACGLTKLPEIAENDWGKPIFPQHPDLQFSISHSGNFVACALAEQPVGLDIQQHRAVSHRLQGTLDSEEREQFHFFQVWTLRESLFKLSGKGQDLRRSHFKRDAAGHPVSLLYPAAAFCLYDIAPDVTMALAWEGKRTAPAPIWIPGRKLCACNSHGDVLY